MEPCREQISHRHSNRDVHVSRTKPVEDERHSCYYWYKVGSRTEHTAEGVLRASAVESSHQQQRGAAKRVLVLDIIAE